IPSKYGAQKTMWIARVFHSLTIVFWVLFVMVSGLGFWAILAVFLSTLMLSYEHYLVSKDFTKIDKAFFIVNGYLGFMFILLIIIEVY
ncbi:MAG: 4-hydroxybenzoate octaprenyltransferase, partial [Sulfurovum sp.]|nr:4-hydroxybenzoate octaprenyltransferase [Sulfurovum sp.]